ncbi:hypothetical protein T12_16417 [Trichinella patagoniensis]|uniref:Uncharacterized protein n=1 Tax=Trichinella patagoniensis TaxID=990121 RepID=A0A0V0ZIZ8_9BILA|nr:hypothetical protein T12_16417 [Trichinella patagoniensis]
MCSLHTECWILSRPVVAVKSLAHLTLEKLLSTIIEAFVLVVLLSSMAITRSFVRRNDGDKARLKTNSKPFLHVSTHVQEKVGHSEIYDLPFISLAPLSQFVNELICIRASLDRV